MEPYAAEILWMVIVGFIIAFILAFGIGANDVANSFGTSVGSGVLTIRQACLLATICEVSGAVLIGYKVSDTMRKGILEVGLYEGHEKELMLGCMAALASSAFWLLLATFLKLPISGTHSIVGSTIGFSLIARGTEGLKWNTLGTIIASWFISPVLSGFVSTVLFLLIRKLILRAKNPLGAGLIALPIFYGATVFINFVSVVLDGPKLLYMDNIPVWIAVLGSALLALLIAILVQIFIVPIQKRKILGYNKKTPVKFNIFDSNESSPNGSPRKLRPVSLVSDGKQLPVITEITELTSLNDNLGKKNNKTNDHAKNFPSHHVNYKIDPEIIRKVESLLGKNSLDNTDLTVTSLNYIDEQQNGIFTNGKALQNVFTERRNSQLSNELFGVNKDNKIPKKSSIAEGEAELKNSFENSNSEQVEHMNDNLKGSESAKHLIISATSPNSSKVPLIESVDADPHTKANKSGGEREDVSMLFSFLQILTATFGSFAHGGNDVSNAIGPLIALFMIYKEGSVMQKAETPIYILIYGGIGISVGLWLWGRRVIETIGNDLTKITPSTGFTIEIGAAMTVLLASKIGLPISTTHCKVGSVVFVGYANSKGSKPPQDEENVSGNIEEKAVNWKLFRNIAYSWVVTVPVTALLSAGIMFFLCQLIL